MLRLDADKSFAYARHIQGWMRPEELRWLHKVAEFYKESIRWLEIGSWKGRSLVMTALGLPEGSWLVSIDPFLQCPTSTTGQVEMTWPFPWVEKHNEISRDLIRKLRPDIELVSFKSTSEEMAIRVGAFDVIFIDGNHTEGVVTKDIELYWPKLKKGGILCGHDRGHPEVRAALKACKVPVKEAAGSIWWCKV